MPRPLDVNRLSRFEPRKTAKAENDAGQGADMSRPEPAGPGMEKRQAVADTPPSPAEPSRWKSREPVMDGQISIKAPLDTLERFKAICAADRRTYAAMLEIFMDIYDKSQR